ncbi:hypothetical protein [Leifsonia sp. AG29]|uniref:hypothetical protein n=1 Tax=Leifsonia sp. AG29 TaxID=2598860 RepID=UPI00131D4DF9|nr:hypothetical protein [Leifsonia sp. AG29]
MVQQRCNREETRLRKYWPPVVISASVLLMAWVLGRSLWNAAQLGGLDAVVLTIAGCVAAVALAFWFVSMKQRGVPAAMHALMGRFPTATVRRVYGERAFTVAISRLASRPWRPKLFAFLVLVIHSEGLEFWTAKDTTALVRIPAASIIQATCRMAPNSQGASWPTLFLEVSLGTDEEQTLTIPVVLMRENGLRFLAASLDETERALESIQAIRAAR